MSEIIHKAAPLFNVFEWISLINDSGSNNNYNSHV